jgi:sugar phosphate isomerase/epimerase
VRRLEFPVIEIHPFGVPQPTPRQFPGFEFDLLPEPERRALREALRGFSGITTHLPFKGLSFFDRDEAAVRRSERALDVAMEATAHFGAQLGVVHVTPPRGKSLEAAWPEILDWLRRRGDRAKSLGFRITVETGYPKSVDEFVRLIREADHGSVGGCIDVGHQIGFREFEPWKGTARGTPEGVRAYNDLILRLVERLGPRLTHLHVHDIEPASFREHRPIRYGVVDYPRLFDALAGIGYRGLLMLEVEADVPEDMAESRARLESFMDRA